MSLDITNKFEVKEEVGLMAFLIAQLPRKNRHNIKTLLKNKQVLVNGKETTPFNYVLRPGDIVGLVSDRIPKEKAYRGISIVFEDRYLIVIDKHAGILSMATDTQKDHTAYSMLSAHVKEQDPDMKIFIVHRLDRDTSGLLVYAKSEEVKLMLQENWNEAVLERTYVALVEGYLEFESGTIKSYLIETKTLKVYSSQNPANGVEAITHYKFLRDGNGYSLLEIKPETGRKNQIRVHLQDLGHSIVGDKKYGAKTNPISRLGLHAMVLSFIHPITEEILRFETSIPRKFLSVFKD